MAMPCIVVVPAPSQHRKHRKLCLANIAEIFNAVLMRSAAIKAKKTCDITVYSLRNSGIVEEFGIIIALQIMSYYSSPGKIITRSLNFEFRNELLDHFTHLYLTLISVLNFSVHGQPFSHCCRWQPQGKVLPQSN